MPASYHIDRANRLVLSRAEGAVTDDDLISHIARLRADADFDPTYDQVFDLLGVGKVEITFNGIRRAVAESAFKPGVRRAFVTERPVLIGLVRMFEQMRRDPQHIRVFATAEQAQAWLAEKRVRAQPSAVV